MAPEYASLGQLSDKADVYSFGVVCLEVVSGRPNIDESVPQDQVYLSQWVRSLPVVSLQVRNGCKYVVFFTLNMHTDATV